MRRRLRVPGGGLTRLGRGRGVGADRGVERVYWAGETSPSPLYGFQALTGVACPAADDCWAVGEGLNHDGTGSRMIIEHFAPLGP